MNQLVSTRSNSKGFMTMSLKWALLLAWLSACNAQVFQLKDVEVPKRQSLTLAHPFFLSTPGSAPKTKTLPFVVFQDLTAKSISPDQSDAQLAKYMGLELHLIRYEDFEMLVDTDRMCATADDVAKGDSDVVDHLILQTERGQNLTIWTSLATRCVLAHLHPRRWPYRSPVSTSWCCPTVATLTGQWSAARWLWKIAMASCLAMSMVRCHSTPSWQRPTWLSFLCGLWYALDGGRSSSIFTWPSAACVSWASSRVWAGSYTSSASMKEVLRARPCFVYLSSYPSPETHSHTCWFCQGAWVGVSPNRFSMGPYADGSLLSCPS